MKITLLYVTLCTLTQAAYISRMANVNRLRAPAVFRPGVFLQRPWSHQRIMPGASYRAPYVLYRGPIPHRYAMKPYGANIRNVFSSSPWKTARIPPAATTEYDLVKAASAPAVVHNHGGAIHTIPAPNLSLSEKPIVVADTSESGVNSETASEPSKTTYEVTEKNTESPVYQTPVKIESPIGFSKQSPLASPELQQFINNGAAFQPSSHYGIPSLTLPQNPIAPQQFTLQGFTELSGHQDLIQTAAEGIVPPNSLYQNDPNFLQKLQNQLLQQFQSVEFIPYATVTQPQIQQTSPQPDLYLLENEVITKQIPTSFKPSEYHRNIVQREVQEGSVQSLVPQGFAPSNVTENLIDDTTVSETQDSTSETESETEAPTTTKQVDETTTEPQKTTPLYYAQIGQSVGNVIANGFYSAINDVRAAAALAQEEIQNKTVSTENVTSTDKPVNELDDVNSNKDKNETINEIKPLVGSPFAKPADSVNVSNATMKSQEGQAKVNKEGNAYTGQLVQTVITDDKVFNQNKPNNVRRPPLRLFAVPEKKVELVPQKLTVVKAKIPPKTKLTFDDKTGEPILRIYASYSENPIQKELLLSKLSSLKHFKDAVTGKQEPLDPWKGATMKSFDKTMANDGQFGIKLRSRSDDYIPLFEEYEE